MLTPFETLSNNARIWVYQANRPLDSQEQEETLVASEAFLTQWAAHGQDLSASAKIMYDQFLIIAIDESFNMASGCSIDSSVHFVQELGKRFEVDFFDRMQIAFLLNDVVKIIPLNEIKSAVSKGEIDQNSLFFQNTTQSKSELEDKWLVRAGESWLKRYFNVAESV